MLTPLHTPKDSFAVLPGTVRGSIPAAHRGTLLKVNPRYVFRASYPLTEDLQSERQLFSRIRAVVQDHSIPAVFSHRVKADPRCSALVDRGKGPTTLRAVQPAIRLESKLPTEKPVVNWVKCRSLHHIAKQQNPLQPVLKTKPTHSKKSGSDCPILRQKVSVPRKSMGRNLSIKLDPVDQLIGWTGDDSLCID